MMSNSSNSSVTGMQSDVVEIKVSMKKMEEKNGSVEKQLKDLNEKNGNVEEQLKVLNEMFQKLYTQNDRNIKEIKDHCTEHYGN